VGSRRACEALIESGAVRVNGHLVDTMPAWVDPRRDVITVNRRRIRSAENLVYVMLFKPRGVVTTNADPEGRKRAIDLVRHPSRTRLFAVGRLELEASGLLLLTNDGELANRLTHPRYELPKRYEITVKGSPDESALAQMEKAMFKRSRRDVAEPRTRRSSLSVLQRTGDRTRLMIELREGRIRDLGMTLARLGHPLKRVRRVQIGPLKLRDLMPGQWRDLTPRELASLRKAAGAADKQP
jgi:pseudouridine synthase